MTADTLFQTGHNLWLSSRKSCLWPSTQTPTFTPFLLWNVHCTKVICSICLKLMLTVLHCMYINYALCVFSRVPKCTLCFWLRCQGIHWWAGHEKGLKYQSIQSISLLVKCNSVQNIGYNWKSIQFFYFVRWLADLKSWQHLRFKLYLSICKTAVIADLWGWESVFWACLILHNTTSLHIGTNRCNILQFCNFFCWLWTFCKQFCRQT